ncbi:hypothetical protein BG005_001953 [Podila minutissima]|nr:hypothetical protein BG005_001953 [Podila minutissima]
MPVNLKTHQYGLEAYVPFANNADWEVASKHKWRHGDKTTIWATSTAAPLCFKCGRDDHKIRDCPDHKKAKDIQQKRAENVPLFSPSKGPCTTNNAPTRPAVSHPSYAAVVDNGTGHQPPKPSTPTQSHSAPGTTNNMRPSLHSASSDELDLCFDHMKQDHSALSKTVYRIADDMAAMRREMAQLFAACYPNSSQPGLTFIAVVTGNDTSDSLESQLSQESVRFGAIFNDNLQHSTVIPPSNLSCARINSISHDARLEGTVLEQKNELTATRQKLRDLFNILRTLQLSPEIAEQIKLVEEKPIEFEQGLAGSNREDPPTRWTFNV